MTATATKTRWPTMSDYQEAVQAPSICFPDSDLRSGTPVMNNLGLPRPICGQFASVYEIETGGRRYAVKCFLRNIPDQHDRYARISEHLRGHGTSYFVTFEYQNDGIRVRGELRPLVKMEWIHGLPLNVFIEKNLSSPATLVELEKRWLDLLEDLRTARIAHGDLQHGNVLVVEDGSLRLIDYDGMWVPALEGQASHETGHPDFQSPRRNAKYFHAGIDLFAGAAIHIVLRALGRDPGLWSRYNNGDNLLFRRQDYLNPGQSALIAELKKLGDAVIDERLKVLVDACKALPTLEEWAAKTSGKSAGTGGKSSRPCEKRQKHQKRQRRRFWRRGREKAPEPQKAPERDKAPAREKTPDQDKAKSGGGKEKPKTAAEHARRNGTDRKTATGRAVEKMASSWLGDHVSGSTVAKEPPPSRGKTPPEPQKSAAAGKPSSSPGETSPETPQNAAVERRPLLFRFLLHVVLLAPMVAPAIAEWFDFLGIDAGALTTLQEIVVNTTMVLGVFSLTTLLIFRKHHHWTSDLFFGFMILVSVYDLSAKLWTIGSPVTLQENLYHFGFGQLLLIISGLGWVLRPDRE